MGEINSNLFELDLDNLLNENNGEIFNNIENKVNIEEVYKNYSEILRSNSKILREKLYIKDVTFNTIDINKDNFAKNQYDILKHKYIALNIEDKVYNFLTTEGTIYKVSDRTLIDIIMNTPRPRKVVYDLPCPTPSVYSMQLLANIMENIKSNSMEELLSEYGYEYLDYYSALNILLIIYPIYEKLIYEYQYNSYINFEHKIYNIFKNISYSIDESKYNDRLNECNNEISILCEKLQLQNTSKYNQMDFLNYIGSKNNDLIYPSLNTELLYSIKLNDYSKLIELLSEKNFFENAINNNLVYDTYFNAGLKTFYPSVIKYTNKIIIRGSYQHLLQNIIAEILNLPDYIQLVNDNKNLLSEVLKSENKQYKDNTVILLEWALLAHITGCNTIEEYKMFFYNHKHTILSDNDMETIINILNNDLHEMINLIDNTSSSTIYNDNLILHGNFPVIYKLILGIQRKLIKDLISEICDYTKDFNNKNKSKINFIGYYDNTIYLECEEDSWIVATDTLTRTLVRIYDKYLRKTKAHCLVENLSI